MDDVHYSKSNDTVYIITDNSYANILQKINKEEHVKPIAQLNLFDNYPSSSNSLPVFRCDTHRIPKDNMAGFTPPLDKLEKLRNSTKQLLCLIEELQSKTHSSDKDDIPKLTKSLRRDNQNSVQVSSSEDFVSNDAVRTLENQTKNLDDIYIQDKKEDCSVYKRLTRECHCLNNIAYNDFIIHFNEDTKYLTSTRGEIIKNIRIIKKFLYMGGGYTKNALTFLHDGLMNSRHCERLDIVQACVYGDVCNIFDDKSIVTVCIFWPGKYETYGDRTTQKMAADILAQIVLVEEGRHYLTFSSKIACDIKKLLKTKSNSFSPELIDALNMTLTSLNQPLTRNINVSYYMKGQEGSAHRTLQTLSRYKTYLTVDEIKIHLELLHSLSQQEEGKKELLQNFSTLLKVFKDLLLEYDSSDLNIAVTNTLINIMTQKKMGDAVSELHKSYVVSEIATEPVRMVHEVQQVPSPTKRTPRRTFGINRNRDPVVTKVPDNMSKLKNINKSNRF